MIFDAYLPTDLGEEELESYGNRVVIDQGGIDIRHFGENVSASFQGVHNEDIALAVLGEEFEEHLHRAEGVAKINGYSYESYLNLGWIYLRAAQIIREAKNAV